MRLQKISFLNLRPKEQAKSLSDLLKNEGAEVIEFPCLEIVPNQLENREIEKIRQAEILVFTSSNGIRIAEEKGLISKNHLIACIGEQSKKCAEALSHKVIFTPKKSDSESFANELVDFLNQQKTTKSLSLLRAKKANPEFAGILQDAGYEINDITLYDSRLPTHEEAEISSLLARLDHLSMLIFTSSEMLRNFVNCLKDNNYPLSKVIKLPVAAIGVKTAETLEEYGFNKIILPQKACVESLVDAILKFFKSHEQN